MQHLCMTRTSTERPLRIGVRLWGINIETGLCVAGTMTECLLRRDVRLKEVESSV